MATTKSTQAPRPSKPYPEYPLTPRGDGRWCKRIRGRIHYFVGTWEDALEEYQRTRDYLYAGKTPPAPSDAVTIRDVCNQFLTLKEHLVDSGELKRRTFNEHKSACARILRVLGKQRLAGDVGPDDFSTLRRDMAKKLGPVALANEINRVRSVFKFAYEHQLIEKPVLYGQGFRRPQPKTMRLQRRKNGLRLFEPQQIKTLLNAASVPMRAMILLGINCGFGNSDCGQLQFRHVDLDAGWFDFPRPKTGVDRRGKLWSETVVALKEAIARRPETKHDEHKPLIFITKQGFSWFKETPDNPISKEYRKLADETKVYRRGLSFYAFRHTFETVAGDTGDQVSVNHVMGHVDASMAANYRERIADSRLERIAQHVHDWLFGQEVRS
jgi:integrase